MTVFNSRAQKPPCSLFSRANMPTIPLSHQVRSQRSPTFLLDHMTKRFLRPRDKTMGHALLPSSETYTLHLNGQWLAFCSSKQTNSPQHEHNRAAFFTVPRGSQRTRSFLPPIAYLTPLSSPPNLLTSCPSIIHSRGVVC